jgi:hypothetical protein
MASYGERGRQFIVRSNNKEARAIVECSHEAFKETRGVTRLDRRQKPNKPAEVFLRLASIRPFPKRLSKIHQEIIDDDRLASLRTASGRKQRISANDERGVSGNSRSAVDFRMLSIALHNNRREARG